MSENIKSACTQRGITSLPGIYYLAIGGKNKECNKFKFGMMSLTEAEHESCNFSIDDVILVPLPILNEEYQSVVTALDNWHSDFVQKNVDCTPEQRKKATLEWLEQTKLLQTPIDLNKTNTDMKTDNDLLENEANFGSISGAFDNALPEKELTITPTG